MEQLQRTAARRGGRALAVGIGLGLAALTSFAAGAEVTVPVIGGFNTTRAPMGGDVIIYGSGFRPAQGQSYVLVNGRQVPVMAWSDVAINVLMNPQAYDSSPFSMDAVYPVQVVVPADTTPKSKPMNLLVTSDPMVMGFRDVSVDSDDAIRVYGVRFGATQGSSYLTLTLTGANWLNPSLTMTVPVMAWSDNVIDAQLAIPAGAPLGLYTLTVHRSDGTTGSNTFTLAFK